MNKAKVEAFAQQLASGINREPVDAQLTMNSGTLGIARASQDGLQVDTAAASKKIVEVVVNPNGAVSYTHLDVYKRQALN